MAEKALVHIPQHQKQGKAQGQPRTGRDAGQQRPERDGQQGDRSQKGQHTELHRRFRQYQQRCQRHGDAAEKAHQPPERIRRAAAETE